MLKSVGNTSSMRNTDKSTAQVNQQPHRTF